MFKEIKDNYITAMKEKDVVKKTTLSLLINEVNKEEKILKRELNNNEVVKVILKEVKKRNQSIEMYTKGNRLDLAEKEIEELKILTTYLPKQLTDEEVDAFIKEFLKGDKDIIEGKLIGAVNKFVNGRFSIDNIKRIVKEYF